MGIIKSLNPIFILSGASPLSIPYTLVGDVIVLTAFGSFGLTTTSTVLSLLVGSTVVDSVTERLAGGSDINGFALGGKFVVVTAGTQSVSITQNDSGTLSSLSIVAMVYRPV